MKNLLYQVDRAGRDLVLTASRQTVGIMYATCIIVHYRDFLFF